MFIYFPLKEDSYFLFTFLLPKEEVDSNAKRLKTEEFKTIAYNVTFASNIRELPPRLSASRPSSRGTISNIASITPPLEEEVDSIAHQAVEDGGVLKVRGAIS